MKKEKLNILYEDKYLIVVNKKSGLLTVSTEKEREKTLFHEVMTYEKKKSKNNKLFVIHRLDKDTSGLVMFAKDIKTKNIMQESWDKVIRKYYAVVHGKMEKRADTLVSYLHESKGFEVFETDDKRGKKAITFYKVLDYQNNFSLLDIEIKTGRKHQIRVQLNNIKHPILGDKKYGKRKSSLRNMALDAYYLKFSHPYKKEEIILNKNVPEAFLSLFKKVSN